VGGCSYAHTIRERPSIVMGGASLGMGVGVGFAAGVALAWAVFVIHRRSKGAHPGA
jgi:hypothetical protein